MSDQLLERLAAYRRDLDDATEHAVDRMATVNAPHPSHRRRALPVLLAIACVVTFIAVVAATRTAGPRTGATATSPTPPPTAAATNTAAGQVTAHFEFAATEVVAGDVLDGWLVIENNSGHDIDIRHDGCAPKWGASLTNAAVPPARAFTWECILDPAQSTLTPGITRLPVSVSASYSGCTRNPVGSDSGMRPCLPEPGNPAPPLPRGEYQAVFVGELPGIPTPAPVKITVVEPPTTT